MSFSVAIGALTFGVTFLLIAVALGISNAFGWPTGAGFLVVAIAQSLIGGAAYLMAQRRLRAMTMVPEETVSTLKENSAWIAKRLSSELR
jgi:uncharacterized membrane protein